jgi:hypothetical protein
VACSNQVANQIKEAKGIGTRKDEGKSKISSLLENENRNSPMAKQQTTSGPK